MAELSGTQVGAPIVPPTTDDKYPTHFSEYGKGGKMEVPSIAERDLIPIERRSIGMFVTIQDDVCSTYQLKGGLTNDNWVELESGSTSADKTSFAYGNFSNVWEALIYLLERDVQEKFEILDKNGNELFDNLNNKLLVRR